MLVCSCLRPAEWSTGVNGDAESHSRRILWDTELRSTSNVDTTCLCRQTKQMDRGMLERAQANTRQTGVLISAPSPKCPRT